MPDDLTAALNRISAELRTFGASDEDTRRLVAAVEMVLKLADEAECDAEMPCICPECWAAWKAGVPKPHTPKQVSWNLDPAKVREAITCELTGPR